MIKFNKISWADKSYKINIMKDKYPDDIFISCISYEERTLGSLKKMNSLYKARFGLLFVNKEFENEINTKKFKKQAEEICIKKKFFRKYSFEPLSIDNPIEAVMKIDKIISKQLLSRKQINVTLDITTFPRNELFTILYYLRHLHVINCIRIIYISPIKYGKWLTKGWTRSTVPPFFEGKLSYKNETALLILTGFEYERPISLIDEIEPSLLILGKPIPSTAKKFRKISDNIINKIKIYSNIKYEVEKCSANDPNECKKSITKIIRSKMKKYNIYVALLGTKLEALGVYLAYEENPNFRVMYPVPLTYNTIDYSEGFRDIYEMQLER